MNWKGNYDFVWVVIIGVLLGLALAELRRRSYARELLREGCKHELEGNAECWRDAPLYRWSCAPASSLRTCNMLERDDWQAIYR